ncbi:hypothetical protein [Maricaulis sp. CAU 1757]
MTSTLAPDRCRHRGISVFRHFCRFLTQLLNLAFILLVLAILGAF